LAPRRNLQVLLERENDVVVHFQSLQPSLILYSLVITFPHFGHFFCAQGAPRSCGSRCPHPGHRQVPGTPPARGPPMRPRPCPTRPCPCPPPGPVPSLLLPFIGCSSLFIPRSPRRRPARVTATYLTDTSCNGDDSLEVRMPWYSYLLKHFHHRRGGRIIAPCGRYPPSSPVSLKRDISRASPQGRMSWRRNRSLPKKSGESV
jgi:hypothetical protein